MGTTGSSTLSLTHLSAKDLSPYTGLSWGNGEGGERGALVLLIPAHLPEAVGGVACGDSRQKSFTSFKPPTPQSCPFPEVTGLRTHSTKGQPPIHMPHPQAVAQHLGPV